LLKWEVIQQFDDFIHTCVKGELENFCVADDHLEIHGTAL